jgi:hopanoid biosynthesis associated RND transporter like protein HpnN
MKDKILRKWAYIAATHPWWVIVVLLSITVLAVISASRLKMEMRWSDLLPMNDPVAQEFDKILKEYKSAETIHIVVQGDEEQMKEFADRIVPQIEELTDYVERVDYKLDKKFLAQHGFMLIKEKDLESTKDMFKDLNLIPLMTSINDNFEKEYIGDEEALSTKEKENEAVRSLDGFYYWLRAIDTFLSDPEHADRALAESAVDQLLYGDPYFLSYDKHTLLIAIRPTFSSMDIDKDVASTNALQAVIDKNLPDFPDIRAGLTGIIPLQKDEMEHTMSSMKISSIVALVLVLILFILTFRMWSAPILAGLNLIISIIIAAGFVGLMLGRLNLMTSMFAVILIGLGIDYSIHIISAYSERRNLDKDATSAMEQALIRSGPGIFTGALTTAAAFFALAISVTQGIKEMGIVLGIGIISAMLTTMFGLPAILVARERVITKLSRRPFKQPHIEFKILERFGNLVARRPILYLAIAIGLTFFFLYQALNIKFDYNMYNVEPKGLMTVALQDTIIEAFDMSPDFAMVTASSIEESYELAEKAKEMPAFSMVEHIGDFLPPEELQLKRRPYVEDIRKSLLNTREMSISYKNIDTFVAELERLDMNIYELSQLAFIGGQDKVDEKCRSIIGNPEDETSGSYILELVERIKQNPEHAARALNLFKKYYMPDLRKKLYDMANPELITLKTLPEHIKERYINDAGDTYLVTIYPREMIWEFTAMRRFNKQVELVSPKVTGNPPLFMRLIDYIARDGLWASILTLGIVFLLLWFDFHSPLMALLAMIPLVAGGIWMVGILKTLGMMLNFINVIGLPMIIGIGIDDGVHLLHRYKFEGFGMTPIVLRTTGKAILLTSLTTMAGFGSLMLGTYRGWADLGMLLSLGVAACFLTTVLYLPAIISLVHWKNENKKATPKN